MHMSTNNIIPLSAAVRFLATQLSSSNSRPHVVLPPHLIKAFLTAESQITYTNRISPNNSFACSHTFPCSSIKFLERVSRPVGITSDSSFSSNSVTTPLSLILPASQLTPLLDPVSQESVLVPPPNSNLVIVNPYYGQIEKFMSRISSNYQINERPKIWAAICTHYLTNGTLWSVEHRSIGELKITNVPYEDSTLKVDMDRLIDDSKVIKDILNTPSLLPQVETYNQINQLLIDQLILEAALTPLRHNSFENVDSFLDNDFKALSNKIIEEAVEVISHDTLFIELSRKNAAYGTVLSTKRLFNKAKYILQNNKEVVQMFANLNADEDIIKMSERNKKEYERIIAGDKSARISHLRDPVKANRYIKKLGSKHGIRTQANSHVVSLLTPDNVAFSNV